MDYMVESPLPNMWSSKDMDDFATILRVTPDTSACDLAIIVEKPCSEVSKEAYSSPFNAEPDTGFLVQVAPPCSLESLAA